MSRRTFVCGNWKLYGTREEARALVTAVAEALPEDRRTEVGVAPPFTALAAIEGLAHEHGIALVAQDVHWEPKGAFTGEVSAQMLADLKCDYCIVGHSERRTLFHETDEEVARKAQALLRAGIAPIVCIGETLEERDAGRTLERVLGQIDAATGGLDEEGFARLVVAYEPVWAIGTGRTATPAQAQEVQVAIRARLAEKRGTLANATRILYGGSVKPANAKEILDQPDVDGALVGGASLGADSFVPIVNAGE